MKTINFPIGAIWECRNKGKIGRIEYCGRKRGGINIWRWSVNYIDGSSIRFDWNTTYKACKEEIPIYGRFKRIK